MLAGSQIGLAPDQSSSARPEAASPEADTETESTADDAGEEPGAAEKPLPIAGYDDLTAREIIPLLEDLTPEQRARVRVHEEANRNRKTVLAKLDRLEQ